MDVQVGKPGKKSDGKRKEPPKAATIRCTDPATLQPLGEVPVVSPEEVRARVERARRAQVGWAQTSFAERRRVLERLCDHLLDHTDELVEVIARDAGKTRENALLGEIWPSCEKIRHTLAHGERDLAPERVSSGLLVQKVATLEYHPLGVIGVICPWSAPLQNILGPTIPALFAGNAVLVKVSEWTSWSAARFQQIFDAVLGGCGHPRELVQIITGYGETGAALCESGVDKIVFTGSMANARRVARKCAETLTPVILELGGKDPMIVCDDAEVDQAVHAALAGTFLSAGQRCRAAERILVMERIYDRFVDRVLSEGLQLRHGPPLAGQIVDVGAMTTPQQVDLVERLVNDAVEKGARVRLGGKRSSLPGQFFEPTILTEVTTEMAIAREETFGPVMCIFRVRDEAEALRVANDSEVGLGSTVFSKDPARAARIAGKLRGGSTVVNDSGLFGRSNGREALRAMCNIKSVMTDRFPVHPPVKLYPVKPGDYARGRAMIELLYRSSPVKRVGGALRLLRQMLSR